uniref:Protein aurora borealis n=1 Tax=Parastrongyloides trichosuri TaxID=131310 RepID=A0A0N4ZV47_PARTI
MTSNIPKVHNILVSPFNSVKCSTPIKNKKISRVVTPLHRSILRSQTCRCNHNPFSPGVSENSFGLHINGHGFSPRMFEYKPENGENENLFGWNIDQMSKIQPISIPEEHQCCYASPNIKHHVELHDKVLKYFKEDHHIPSPNTTTTYCSGHGKELVKTPLTSKKFRTNNSSLIQSSSKSICVVESFGKSPPVNISISIEHNETPKLSQKVLELISSPIITNTEASDQLNNDNNSNMFLYFPDEDYDYKEEISLGEECLVPVTKAGAFIHIDDSYLQFDDIEHDYSHQKADFDISGIDSESSQIELMFSPIPSSTEDNLSDIV